MGLVKCSKCSNIYDYNKYNGICPKCARYNKETTAAEEHQAYHDKYDGGYEHTAQDDHHAYHQRYDENKNPHDSRLEGIQEAFRDIKDAEHKINLETAKNGKSKMNKKTLVIMCGVFAVLFFTVVPFFGPFVLIVALWAFIAWKGIRKNNTSLNEKLTSRK